jgi:hypothetical protein
MCAHSGLLFVLLMGSAFSRLRLAAAARPELDRGRDRAYLHDRPHADTHRHLDPRARLVLWWSFSAVIATQMKRIEGRTIPGHDPSWTAAEIVRIFTTDRTRIRSASRSSRSAPCSGGPSRP